MRSGIIDPHGIGDEGEFDESLAVFEQAQEFVQVCGGKKSIRCESRSKLSMFQSIPTLGLVDYQAC